MKQIGVLALQGAVEEHLAMISRTGNQGAAIKETSQLSSVDGLILPGGESTAIAKLMAGYGFIDAIREFAVGRPVFGTCAGMVLLAESGALGLMDVTVRRNAFGRQRESFEAPVSVSGFSDPYEAVFIRAPYIETVGADVEPLARLDGKIVLARQGNLLSCSFHPELTDDLRVIELFLTMAKSA